MDTTPAWYEQLVLLLDDDEAPLSREQIKAGVTAAVQYVNAHRAEVQPLQLRLDAKDVQLEDAADEIARLRQANADLAGAYQNVNEAYGNLMRDVQRDIAERLDRAQA